MHPRLTAESADLGRIEFMSMYRHGFEESPRLPDDVRALEHAVRLTRARLVIVDPLAAHFGKDVDSFRDQSVRAALAPLKVVAEETGAVILIVAHLNKDASTDPILRAGGSIGIIGAARSALLLGNDPTDPEGPEGSMRVLAQAKLNLARYAPSLSYVIESIYLPDDPEIDTGRLVPTGESSYGARDLLGVPADRGERTKVDEAIDWLAGELENGPVAVKNLRAKCETQGFSWRTVETAKERLGIKAERVGFGGDGIWSWRLPDEEGTEDG